MKKKKLVIGALIAGTLVVSCSKVQHLGGKIQEGRFSQEYVKCDWNSVNLLYYVRDTKTGREYLASYYGGIIELKPKGE